jgi:hypothetical protein
MSSPFPIALAVTFALIFSPNVLAFSVATWLCMRFS